MARGTFTTTPKRVEEQFAAVNDLRLQASLAALSDRYSEAVRNLIYATYNDNELASIYRGIRNAAVFQKGGRSKVHRKIVEFPNPYVADFVDTVMTSLHGPGWMQDKRNFRHELIRQWWVVDKL
jgi:hypothetical protein